MGIKKNFVYNSILTASAFLFPLITYPYVSRVLGVTNIGICNFVDSIINYFILFSSMGIGVVGIREVAKAKGNSLRLSKVFSSLWLLVAIMTALMLFILLIATMFIPQLKEYTSLMMIGACKLIGNLFLIEWFYKGIEDFRYITYRSLFVKTAYVICVFIFVRESTDYLIYYVLSAILVAFNAVFNMFYSRNFVRFVWDKITLKEFQRPFFILGAYALLTSMYTSFNVVFLGFTSNVTEVAYYTTATKFHGIILAFFSAFTGVMLPRMSVLVSENKMEEVRHLTQKSFELLFMFCIPLIVFFTFFAPEMIRLVAGDGYEGAITPMRMVMPLVLIIGLEQILIIQLLMPLRNDKAILFNSIVGAMVGLVFNIVLVPIWAAEGSAMVWLVSEVAVLLSASYFLQKQIHLHIPLKKILYALISSFPYILLCWISTFVDGKGILTFVWIILGFSLVFVLINLRTLYPLYMQYKK
ncbi:flippase [Phocaeicola sp.]